MEEIIDGIQYIEEETETLIAVVSMATFGGLVNWLRQKGPRNFSRLIVVLCTAAFAGLVAYYATSALGFNSQYQCAFSGMAGYGGGTLLDEGVKRMKSIIHTGETHEGENKS